MVDFYVFSPLAEFLMPIMKFKITTKSDSPLSPSLTLKAYSK